MQRPQSIEAAGATIEDAIARGLEALNAERRAVDIEVISESAAREARVRLTLKAHSAERPVEEAAVAPAKVEAAPSAAGAVAAIGDEDAATARQILEDVLRRMQLPAQVQARMTDAPAGAHDTEPLLILDIRGIDASLLIGRRGETLENLQYLVRLLVGKAVGRFVNLTIDVEGYKSHREQMLQQLAHRMAERVAQTHKPATLEPMPANERRIIHLTLRNHPHVRTESIGSGESRKVTIQPKSTKH